LGGIGAEQSRFQAETLARESPSIAKRSWLLLLAVAWVSAPAQRTIVGARFVQALTILYLVFDLNHVFTVAAVIGTRSSMAERREQYATALICDRCGTAGIAVFEGRESSGGDIGNLDRELLRVQGKFWAESGHDPTIYCSRCDERVCRC
jgi:hypothetical protein